MPKLHVNLSAGMITRSPSASELMAFCMSSLAEAVYVWAIDSQPEKNDSHIVSLDGRSNDRSVPGSIASQSARKRPQSPTCGRMVYGLISLYSI
jgi:hypothetical protein